MKDIIKAIAEANDFGFDFGRDDFHNLFDKKENKGKPYIFLDTFDLIPIENDNGDIEAITFVGALTIGLSSSIDELSYESRYDDYFKSLALPAVDVIRKAIKCGFNTTFHTPKEYMVINYTSYNFDGIIVDYTVTIDIDKLPLPPELELELEAQEGGIVEPYEGSNTYPPFTPVAINAVAAAGFAFKEWLINGIVNTNKLTTVFMNKYTKAVAYFKLIPTFQLDILSSVNGTTNPVDGIYNIIEYENIEVEAIPNINYAFHNFDINGVLFYENPLLITMNEDKIITPNFYDTTINNNFPYTFPFNLI